VTVLEGIQKSADFLQKKGVDSARLNAELLLAHVLRLPRMQLYLSFERILAPGEVEALREIVRRRGLREPLQHIIGSASFCGLEFLVNRHTLVPRPETELLAESGWQFLNALDPSVAPPSACDFGTGSGCIAITLAVKSPHARIHALDISPAALAVARQNASLLGATHRIQFLEGDGFSALDGAAPAPPAFDLVISNPPYIAGAEIAALQPEVRDYDPHGALDGGLDGLDFYRRLAAEAGGKMTPRGRLMLELGDGQCDAVREILAAHSWIVDAVRHDYNSQPRVLSARAG
jgi:release factor glutamine methyltransferase